MRLPRRITSIVSLKPLPPVPTPESVDYDLGTSPHDSAQNLTEDADYAGLWSYEPRSPGQIANEIEHTRKFEVGGGHRDEYRDFTGSIFRLATICKGRSQRKGYGRHGLGDG